MKKLINDPLQVVDETIAGILKAYPYHLRMTKESPRALVRADAPIKGKVAICTGEAPVTYRSFSVMSVQACSMVFPLVMSFRPQALMICSPQPGKLMEGLVCCIFLGTTVVMS